MDQPLIDEIVRRIRTVTGQDGQRIELHRPFANDGDAGNVYLRALSDPVGYGAIKAFEDLVADACGVAHAVAVSSGTAALHLALLANGVGPGDKVALPTLTFAAAAAAIRYCGAEPVFDPPANDGRTFAAQIGVHLLGKPDEALATNSARIAPVVIEDAAAALGSRWLGKPCGSFGDIGILSFNNNKIVTTGGGGAVLTDSEDMAEKVRHLGTTARVPDEFHYEHDMVGFNYRMGNMAAALGLGQMLALPTILERKRAIRDAYADALSPLEDVFVYGHRTGERWNCWLNHIEVAGTHVRDALFYTLRANGIASRALFTPLHLQLPYKHWSFDAVAGKRAVERWNRTVCLPSGRMPKWQL